MQANAAAGEKDPLPEEEVIAQMSLVSRDTPRGTIKLTNLENVHPGRIGCYLECALVYLDRSHPTPGDQRKLRHELLEARAADGLPYDELGRLPILDATIRETLRL